MASATANGETPYGVGRLHRALGRAGAEWLLARRDEPLSRTGVIDDILYSNGKWSLKPKSPKGLESSKVPKTEVPRARAYVPSVIFTNTQTIHSNAKVHVRILKSQKEKTYLTRETKSRARR